MHNDVNISFVLSQIILMLRLVQLQLRRTISTELIKKGL